MPEELKRFAPTKQTVTLQTMPPWRGFSEKLKKIDPDLQQAEDEIKAWMRAMERRLTEVIESTRT